MLAGRMVEQRRGSLREGPRRMPTVDHHAAAGLTRTLGSGSES